jgi:diadenosine tetraphosphatase ApaH/serine/threonine PP2A family protein phosphatase
MGHTHLPFIWEGRKGHLLNPGSVGQPRGGSPDASYIILKIKDQQVKFEHRIVPYDVNTAAAKIREANLPEYLATRLSRGV